MSEISEALEHYETVVMELSMYREKYKRLQAATRKLRDAVPDLDWSHVTSDDGSTQKAIDEAMQETADAL